MFNPVLDVCRQYPQILVFLTLAFGYVLGKIKFFGFSFGATTCVLLVAIVLGQIGIDVPELLKNISFALFTFCIGYKVGPQFFGALKKEGVKYIWVSLVVAFVALGVTILLGKLYGFDPGTTAGMFAGSVTESAAIGTAEGAIKHLVITEAQKATLNTNVAVSYAITYVFGTAGMLIFLKLVPFLFKVNLKEEARKLELSMTGVDEEDEKPELFFWKRFLELRVYRVTNQNIIGKKINETEVLFPGRVAIDKLKRGQEIIKPEAGMTIQDRDILAVVGRNPNLIKGAEIIGPEVEEAEITGLVGEVLDICILNKKVVGKTLGEISKSTETHGLFLRKITRQGHELPLTRNTVINKCDIFQIMGTKEDVERIVKQLGYAERPTAITDLITVGFGCVLGTLIGLIAIPVAGIPITLGIGGGVLVSGLIFGWLRSLHPTFGQIPEGSQWVLMNLGLNLFVACVGLAAGPKALEALQTTGLSIFFAGCILALAPVIAGLLFGKYVLKMNIVLLLGALAGARVITAALNMLQEDADSSIPILGYAAPYAFGNVLLTIWGTVIVNIM